MTAVWGSVELMARAGRIISAESDHIYWAARQGRDRWGNKLEVAVMSILRAC